MFDQHINKIIQKPLYRIALKLAKMKIKANQITITGFLMGLIAFIQIVYGNYIWGLVFILFNRLLDGLDGSVAQIENPTDSGAFLDIVMDFIFYSLIPLSFGIALPNSRLVALILIFSFVTTGTTFLAFSILAQKHQLHSNSYPNKAFYYLGGITEGSETVLFFILFCIFPSWFNFLAYTFSALCLLTCFFRIVYGYNTLSKAEKDKKDPRKKFYNNIL